jgi:hypothetical protein
LLDHLDNTGDICFGQVDDFNRHVGDDSSSDKLSP